MLRILSLAVVALTLSPVAIAQSQVTPADHGTPQGAQTANNGTATAKPAAHKKHKTHKKPAAKPAATDATPQVDPGHGTPQGKPSTEK